MQIGAVYPQIETGTHPDEVREFAQGVEQLGYQHILVYDHVMGADPAGHPELKSAPYNIDHPFHEPFVLFSYIAAVAPGLELVSGIIILPQRQAALVAKQASSLDVLCQGKFRLGVGIGWNPIEYQALGAQWKGRAQRFEEQIAYIRELSSKRLVTFQGEYHEVLAAGINPLPVQRPLPIWIGAAAPAAVRRAARIADGFFPLAKGEDRTWAQEIETLHGYLREYGRDPSTFGIEATLRTDSGTPDTWRQQVEEWRSLGASHLCVSTMGAGLSGAGEHLKQLERVAEVLRP